MLDRCGYGYLDYILTQKCAEKEVARASVEIRATCISRNLVLRAKLGVFYLLIIASGWGPSGSSLILVAQ